MADTLPLLKATHTSCVCSVCLDVLKNPVAFRCGHVLCRGCALRCIEARPRCPLCNSAVPNARHLVPLPQLSLFCVLTREIGLRGQKTARLRADAAEGEEGEEGVLGGSPGVKRDRVRDDKCNDEDDAQQHGRREPRHDRIPSSSSSTPAVPVVPQWLSNHRWRMQRDVAQALARSTAGDTQRLIDNALSPSSDHSMSNLADAVMALGVLECNTSTQRESRGGDDHDSGSSAVAGGVGVGVVPAASAAASSAATVAVLQAHFAGEAEVVESTPRLRSPAPDATVMDAQEESGRIRGREPDHQQLSNPTEEQAEMRAARFPWWRRWRRDGSGSSGGGIVVCSLLPPEVRRRLHEAETPSSSTSAASHGAVGGRAADDVAGADSTTKTAAWGAAAAAQHFHRSGCCVLCGLDVVCRTTVRRRLRTLLHSPTAQCDAAELAAQTEDGLALLLGPLWGVECGIDAQTSLHISSSARLREYACVSGEAWLQQQQQQKKKRGRAKEGKGESDDKKEAACVVPLRAVAHHNCLAWAGLLDRYTDTSVELTGFPGKDAALLRDGVVSSTQVLRMAVPLVDPFALLASHASGREARWQLLAATLWHRKQLQVQQARGDGDDGAEGVAVSRPSTVHSSNNNTNSSRDISGRPTCYLCREPTAAPAPQSAEHAVADLFGVGLRTCEGPERGLSSCGRSFHFPCALLAGAAACVVYGLEDTVLVVAAQDDTCVGALRGEASTHGRHCVDVWCGTCGERHDGPHHSRNT